MTWQQAMDRYGVDKPDMRFGMELRDLTDVVRGRAASASSPTPSQPAASSRASASPAATTSPAATSRGGSPRWCAPSRRAGSPTSGARRRLAGWDRQVLHRRGAGRDRRGDRRRGRGRVLMVADRRGRGAAALGALRNHLGARAARCPTPTRMAMIWVTEFPMFERNEETGEIGAAHHPFTMVHIDDSTCSKPTRSRCGRAPTTSSSTAARSAAAASASPTRRSSSASSPPWASTPRRRSASSASCSRHSSTACRRTADGPAASSGWSWKGSATENIRDVIAFPKNQQAQEPMTDAPAPVDPMQLRELGLRDPPSPPKP